MGAEKADDQGVPIKIDATSNGEFAPVPISPALRAANGEARQAISNNAARTGRSRRAFLTSLCGSATALLTFDAAQAALGRRGGAFRVPAEAAFDVAAAADTLAGEEFIFDVHTHVVNPAGAWRTNRGKYWERALAGFPQGSCGEADPIDCFSADYFTEEIFLKSDTDAAVLTFVPETPEGNPLDPEEAKRVKTLIERLGDGRHRLLLHAMTTPNLEPKQEQLDRMAAAAKAWPIAAWKVYTQWGIDGAGWALDDPAIGAPFIETARETGVKTICIHKGLPFPGMELQHAGCADVGRAARLFPDVNFLVYHSGIMPSVPEGAFNPDTTGFGVDSLIKSLIDNDIAPNSNVYADLGTTWRYLMRDLDQAAHVIGKLLKYVGEDRLLWGTDSIWYGSPQDQIEAFRVFEIAEALQEAYGYPALTPNLKAKIFGLNGAAVYGLDPAEVMRKAALDTFGRRKAAGFDPQTDLYAVYGPQTMQEYVALLRAKAGRPG